MSSSSSLSSSEDNYVAKRFITEVNEVIPSKDRDVVFDALKRYQSSMELSRLIQDLTRVLDDPSKLEIFEHIRPLIPPKHQIEYDKLAPAPPGRKLRVIKLRRHGNESFGFAVRGGFEHGIGVFVSHVTPGSQSERMGLQVGDEIVRVNGYTIAEAIHEEVLNLIKGRDYVELKVTNIGMLPIKENVEDTVKWKYVDKPKKRHSNAKINAKNSKDVTEGEEVKLFANLRSAPSLGCSIVSGPVHHKGIFVAKVNEGSLGEEIGLELGDQIVSVNGTSFLEISRNEAVVALKESKELNLVIRKKAGLALMQTSSVSQSTGSEASSKQKSSGNGEPPQSNGPQVPPPPPVEPPVIKQPDERQADSSFQEQIIRRQQHLVKGDVEYAVVQKKRERPGDHMTELKQRLEEEMKSRTEHRRKTIEEDDRMKMEEKQAQIKIRQEQEFQEKMAREREETERLQKLLQDKLQEQRLKEERLRQEVYETNRKKRNVLEHKLLAEIRRHQGEREHSLRLQRQRQDEEEIKRELAGAAGGNTFLNMLRRSLNHHKVEHGSLAQSDILKGKGGPLKKQNYKLLGIADYSEQSTSKKPVSQDHTDIKESTHF